MNMFDKTRDEVIAEPRGIMGANMVTLADDMLTVNSDPVRIVPGQFEAAGTTFEGHAFFEASSIRKIGDIYYFIYSSQLIHELCYATSSYPDRDFVYRGIIVSNGDVGYKGRLAKDRTNATGNNHGSIEYINNKWYIFYHRHTHKTNYCRQTCAEMITITEDGMIPQVEMTSIGLNNQPLQGQGEYPAVIACQLTNGNMPHLGGKPCNDAIPYITHEGNEHFITDIREGTKIGYKYFCLDAVNEISVTVKGTGKGYFEVWIDGAQRPISKIDISTDGSWNKSIGGIKATKGKHALYFIFHGIGAIDFQKFTLV